jgi:TP901 family phage tail tape measure protein
MANLNIAIKIAAQDQASGPIGKITGGLRDMGSMAGGTASQGFAGLQKVVGGGLFAAAGIATGAIAAVGGAAVATAALSAKSFIDFEGKMREVYTLLPGISQDAMSAMMGDVKDLAKEFGTMPNDVVPALYQALSAGVPQDNVFEFLKVANKAAIGGVTDLETAVDGITSTVNAYGADIMDAARASDVMFTTVRLGKTDFGQLSASLFNVLPTASSLGVAFEDVGAALATVTAQGVPTSVATTQLRSLFIELGDSSKGAAKIFKEMAGVTFSEFIAEGGNVQEALQLMELRADKLGVGVNELFSSVEAGNAALGLTGAAAETFSDALEEMRNATGATDAAFEMMNAGLGRSIERMKAFGATALLDIGEALSPAIGVVLDFAESALPKIQDVIETMVVPAIGLVIDVVNGLIEGFVTAREMGLDPLRAAFYAIQSELEVLGFRELSDQVGDFEGMLREAYATVVDFIMPIWDAITAFVSWKDILIVVGIVVASIVLPALYSIIAAALPVIAVAVALIAAVALLRNAWENNWGDIQGKTAAVTEFIRNALASIAAWWAANGENILATVSAMWTGVKTYFSEAAANIKNMVDGLLTAVRGFWDRNSETIMAVVANFWQFLQRTFENATQMLQGVIELFHAIWNRDSEAAGAALRSIFEAVWDQIKNIFSTAFTNIIAGITIFITEIKSAFSNVDWSAVGRAVIEGIARGISNAGSFLADAARNAAKNALDAAKGFLGISSPSRVAAEMIGLPFSEGVAMGITRGMGRIQLASTNMAGAAVGSASTVINNNYSNTINANYSAQDERGIRDDMQLLAMLR